jgi:hypothetical protein
LNSSAILKIQVHRDCGKKFADHRRFMLATNIEAHFCDLQNPWQRGPKFEEGPVLAQSGQPRLIGMPPQLIARQEAREAS